MKRIKLVAFLLALVTVLTCLTSCTDFDEVIDRLEESIFDSDDEKEPEKSDDKTSGNNTSQNGNGKVESGTASSDEEFTDDTLQNEETNDKSDGSYFSLADGSLYVGVQSSTTTSMYERLVIATKTALKSNTTYIVRWTISQTFLEDYPEVYVETHPDDDNKFIFRLRRDFKPYIEGTALALSAYDLNTLLVNGLDGITFTTGDIPSDSVALVSLFHANVTPERGNELATALKDYVTYFEIEEVK